MISCFCRSVGETFALLGCYTELIGSWLPMFQDSLLVLSSRVRRWD
jgi:hypothetical protein